MRKDSEKRETYHILRDVVCLLQVKPFFLCIPVVRHPTCKQEHLTMVGTVSCWWLLLVVTGGVESGSRLRSSKHWGRLGLAMGQLELGLGTLGEEVT